MEVRRIRVGSVLDPFVGTAYEAAFTLEGAGGSAAHIANTVSAEAPRDVWGADGVKLTARIIHVAADVDFVIEVKFNSQRPLLNLSSGSIYGPWGSVPSATTTVMSLLPRSDIRFEPYWPIREAAPSLPSESTYPTDESRLERLGVLDE